MSTGTSVAREIIIAFFFLFLKRCDPTSNTSRGEPLDFIARANANARVDTIVARRPVEKGGKYSQKSKHRIYPGTKLGKASASHPDGPSACCTR